MANYACKKRSEADKKGGWNKSLLYLKTGGL